MRAPRSKSLRDKPFELLRELERLARVALTGQGRDARNEREWVGVAFRLSSENFLVAREETREVLGFPRCVTRVPGAKPWIRGLANVRGQLLPVVDLRAFLGGGVTNTGRSTRVLVAQSPRSAGRTAGRRSARLPPFRGRRVFRRRRRRRSRAASAISPARSAAATESWPVFSLRTLLESAEFLQAAAS